MTQYLIILLGSYAVLCIFIIAFVGILISMIEYNFPEGHHNRLQLLRDLAFVALLAFVAPLWLPLWWLWNQFSVDSKQDRK